MTFTGHNALSVLGKFEWSELPEVNFPLGRPT